MANSDVATQQLAQPLPDGVTSAGVAASIGATPQQAAMAGSAARTTAQATQAIAQATSAPGTPQDPGAVPGTPSLPNEPMVSGVQGATGQGAPGTPGLVPNQPSAVPGAALPQPAVPGQAVPVATPAQPVAAPAAPSAGQPAAPAGGTPVSPVATPGQQAVVPGASATVPTTPAAGALAPSAQAAATGSQQTPQTLGATQPSATQTPAAPDSDTLAGWQRLQQVAIDGATADAANARLQNAQNLVPVYNLSADVQTYYNQKIQAAMQTPPAELTINDAALASFVSGLTTDQQGQITLTLQKLGQLSFNPSAPGAADQIADGIKTLSDQLLQFGYTTQSSVASTKAQNVMALFDDANTGLLDQIKQQVESSPVTMADLTNFSPKAKDQLASAFGVSSDELDKMTVDDVNTKMQQVQQNNQDLIAKLDAGYNAAVKSGNSQDVQFYLAQLKILGVHGAYGAEQTGVEAGQSALDAKVIQVGKTTVSLDSLLQNHDVSNLIQKYLAATTDAQREAILPAAQFGNLASYINSNTNLVNKAVQALQTGSSADQTATLTWGTLANSTANGVSAPGTTGLTAAQLSEILGYAYDPNRLQTAASLNAAMEQIQNTGVGQLLLDKNYQDGDYLKSSIASNPAVFDTILNMTSDQIKTAVSQGEALTTAPGAPNLKLLSGVDPSTTGGLVTDKSQQAMVTAAQNALAQYTTEDPTDLYMALNIPGGGILPGLQAMLKSSISSGSVPDWSNILKEAATFAQPANAPLVTMFNSGQISDDNVVGVVDGYTQWNTDNTAYTALKKSSPTDTNAQLSALYGNTGVTLSSLTDKAQYFKLLSSLGVSSSLYTNLLSTWDVNKDGTIDASDIAAVAKAASSNPTPTKATDFLNYKPLSTLLPDAGTLTAQVPQINDPTTLSVLKLTNNGQNLISLSDLAGLDQQTRLTITNTPKYNKLTAGQYTDYQVGQFIATNDKAIPGQLATIQSISSGLPSPLPSTLTAGTDDALIKQIQAVVNKVWSTQTNSYIGDAANLQASIQGDKQLAAYLSNYFTNFQSTLAQMVKLVNNIQPAPAPADSNDDSGGNQKRSKDSGTTLISKTTDELAKADPTTHKWKVKV